jgi:outer membrane lipoprotein-sorting protein
MQINDLLTWRNVMKNKYVKTILRTFFLLLLLLWLPPIAEGVTTPEEKGLEIARESDRRDAGFGNYIVTLKMLLRSRGGKENIRELHIKALEVSNDGDKSQVVFDTPKDIKGTAFLTFSHKVDDDDQWLYLPALKRVKRISSRNKSSPFMGSEFSYEDMASQEVEKYRYKWLRDENLNGIDCFVIESYPVDKENSGYVRQVVWIDKSEYRVQKIDYYDRKNTLLKTLAAHEYKQYDGRFWKPLVLKMVNHQTGKTTILKYANYRFGVDLDDRDFTKTSLRRAR